MERYHHSPLVCDVLPEFAAELVALLSRVGEAELVGQVQELRLVERCRCGDDFCATLYTAPRPGGAWGPGHYTLALSPEVGIFNVDVLDGKIVELEILFRDEIRARLLRLLP
jgi:hypothetical protein